MLQSHRDVHSRRFSTRGVSAVNERNLACEVKKKVKMLPFVQRVVNRLHFQIAVWEETTYKMTCLNTDET